MANTFLKPEVIASTALGLLERDLILTSLVWTDTAAVSLDRSAPVMWSPLR